ncbi:MAG: histidine kinase [Bacteroidota bacterium]
MTISIRQVWRWVYSWRVPIFFIAITLLILIFNDVFGDQDGFIVFSLLFFMTMSIVVVRWLFREVKSIWELKKEKKQVELLHLKSQVNPHFFFNTLNNLYGLVEKDTEQAQRLILKLSAMMRYSIYEGQNDLVTLGEEIDYLQRYLELHQMRYHKTIDSQFDIQVEDRSILVMPLLFIILVENAFKHGVENLRKDAFVHLKLVTHQKKITFEIVNNFDREEMSTHSGIGLANLKRRLELIYPDQHQLTTKIEDSLFKAQLNLTL